MLHTRRAWTVASFAVAIAIATTLASPAAAQIRVVQNSCDTSGADPVVQFAFVSAPGTGVSVCRIVIFPMSAACFPLQCITPAGWSCFPGDVATFLQADNQGDACIAPGETLGGFQLGLSGNPCCLTFIYSTADGTGVGEEEFCFDCQTIGVDRQTWGVVKRLYE